MIIIMIFLTYNVNDFNIGRRTNCRRFRKINLSNFFIMCRALNEIAVRRLQRWKTIDLSYYYFSMIPLIYNKVFLHKWQTICRNANVSKKILKLTKNEMKNASSIGKPSSYLYISQIFAFLDLIEKIFWLFHTAL